MNDNRGHDATFNRHWIVATSPPAVADCSARVNPLPPELAWIGPDSLSRSFSLQREPKKVDVQLYKPSVLSSSSEMPTTVTPKSAVNDSHALCKNEQKKGPEKKVRQPRYAFMTKSEVDHLEDGYRWRKYGQKAVKNSPYPRSYYRCTNGKCLVKKRVERSSEDPSIVVTTYEGQHCHHSFGLQRVFVAQDSPPLSAFDPSVSYVYNEGMQVDPNGLESGSCSINEGLLGDVVRPGSRV